MGITAPDNFAKWFRDDIKIPGSKEQFLVELTDDATSSIATRLLDEAIRIADDSSVPMHSAAKVDA